MATVQSAREPRTLARAWVRPTRKVRTCQGRHCFRLADARTSAKARQLLGSRAARDAGQQRGGTRRWPAGAAPDRGSAESP